MESFEYIIEQHQNLREKKASWLRGVLFLCVSLFGIVVSLSPSTAYSPHSHLLFSISIGTLALGILSVAATIYGAIDNLERSLERYLQEARQAKAERRNEKAVYTPMRKIFVLSEKVAYASLTVSLVSFSLYAILR